MKIDLNDFKALEGKTIDLKGWPTLVPPLFDSTAEYEAVLKQQVEGLSARQQLHYASARYAILLILQGMDAAGKDGTIQHIMSGVDPQGCEVFSFKAPSEEELKHDFLWRTTCRLPERGRIGIFNRSYYEEVLVVRVHPTILDAEKLPEDSRNENRIWEHRFRSISDSPTWRNISIETERVLSRSFCIFRRTSRKSGSSHAFPTLMSIPDQPDRRFRRNVTDSSGGT